MEPKVITTEQVAKMMGIGVSGLVVYLHRHPELRPAQQYGNAFIWTKEEIEALAQQRARPISRGPHAKKGAK